VPLASESLEHGSSDFDSSAMMEQLYVDRDAIAQRVLRSLGRYEQVSLSDVVSAQPLELGLAELVGYMSLSEPGLSVTFDEERREQIGWGAEDVERVADAPRVVFTRNRSETS
jgi:hypothetical protein